MEKFIPNPPKFGIHGGIGDSVKVVDKDLGDWTHLNDGLRSFYVGKIGRVVEVNHYNDTFDTEDDDYKMLLRQQKHDINGHGYRVRFPTSYDPNHEGPVEITFVEEHLELSHDSNTN